MAAILITAIENCSGSDWREHSEIMGLNSLTAIRVLAGTKNSRPVGFYSRNSTKSTVNPNTTIHKHHHHGGAVRPSFGVRSMDPPDRTRDPLPKGSGGGVVEANYLNR